MVKIKRTFYITEQAVKILNSIVGTKKGIKSNFVSKSILLLNAIFDNLQDGEKYSQDEVIKAINHYREFKKLSFSYNIPENEDLKEILKIGLKFTGIKNCFKD